MRPGRYARRGEGAPHKSAARGFDLERARRYRNRVNCIPSPWRAGALLAGVVVLAAAGDASYAGEKIIFSGRETSKPAVDLNRKESLMERGLHTPKLPGDSPADSLTIAVAPQAPKPRLTRRQQEELDERRDWMFRNPNAASIKDAVKTSRADDEREADPRRKTAIERFVEDGNPKGDDDSVPGEPRARREGTARATLRPEGPREGGVSGNAINGALAASSPANPARDAGRTGPADMRGFEFTGRVPLDPARERLRSQAVEADSAAFQRAVGGSIIGTTGMGAGFPAAGTATTRDWNAGAGAPPRAYLQAPGAFVPGATKSGFMDSARLGGAAAFDPRLNPVAPAQNPPSTEPPRKMEPRPTVLEIPKRKF